MPLTRDDLESDPAPENPADLAIRMVRNLTGRDAQMLCYYLGISSVDTLATDVEVSAGKMTVTFCQHCDSRIRLVARLAIEEPTS